MGQAVRDHRELIWKGDHYVESASGTRVPTRFHHPDPGGGGVGSGLDIVAVACRAIR